MKPNTLALGYYSPDLPVSTLDNLLVKLQRKPWVIRRFLRDTSLEKFEEVSTQLPELRTDVSPTITPQLLTSTVFSRVSAHGHLN